MSRSDAFAAPPLIGISTRLDPENNFYLRRYYGEAVHAAGALPVYIPLIPERAYLTNLIDRLDGLLLSGSNSDIDPIHYNEEPHPKLGPVCPERDGTDLLLLELAEARALPTFGICFGMQSLNVQRGGSLIQDIGSQIDKPIKHEQGIPANRHSHHIEIEADSLLARWAGGARARVNSSHHQAVGRVGRDLRVIAYASDGVIEAVVDPRAGRFVVGVQWHPEIGHEADALSQIIFRRFVEEAARFNARRETK